MNNQDLETLVLKKVVKTSHTHIEKPGQPKVSIGEDGEENITTKKVSITMGQFITKARNDKGLKQLELAKKCNLDSKVIGEIERGGGTYNHAHINLISKALGVKISRDL